MGASIIFAISCNFLPLIAWLVINQDWQFYIPIIDIVYKPWRFYLVVNSLFGLFACIIITFLPESPKFVLDQGIRAEAYRILQTMNRINNGKTSKFDCLEIYEDIESIKNRQRMNESKSRRYPFLSTVWIQTAPLFRSPHLFATILICFLQFCIFATTNGFLMFLAEILNKMATNLDDYINQRAMMCDIINMKSIQQNQTNSENFSKVSS